MLRVCVVVFGAQMWVPGCLQWRCCAVRSSLGAVSGSHAMLCCHSFLHCQFSWSQPIWKSRSLGISGILHWEEESFSLFMAQFWWNCSCWVLLSLAWAGEGCRDLASHSTPSCCSLVTETQPGFGFLSKVSGSRCLVWLSCTQPRPTAETRADIQSLLPSLVKLRRVLLLL